MSEMRAHRRLVVDFDAFVTANGLRDHPCKVRDFCLGGALLSFEDPLRAVPPALALLERGAIVEVRVETRSPGFRDAYTFKASVARRDRQQLGVAFSSPDPTSLMALQSIANINSSQLRTGVRPERRRGRPESGVHEVIGAVRNTTQQLMGGLPAQLFSQARTVVAELTAHAGNDEDIRRIEDSLATLRRHANNLQNAFLQQALKPLGDFDKWQPGATIPATSNSYRLSLIEKGAFEDWLSLKVMVSRAESECQESLFELHIRFNELLGTTLAVQSNPVGPAVFVHAMGEPLQKLRLPKPVEQGLLKALEGLLLENLRELYVKLNAVMVEHGVLPDLELGRHLRATAAAAAALHPQQRAAPMPAPAASGGAASGEVAVPVATASPALVEASPPPAAPAPSTAPAPLTAEDRSRARAALSVRQFEMQQRIARQSYSTIQRLLAVRQVPAAPATTAAGAGVETAVVEESCPDIDLAAVLRQVQATDTGTTLQARLAHSLGDNLASHLPPTQAAAVETVDELFNQMLSSTLLREDTRHLLRQLDVPVLKVLMHDAGFLTNEDHPLRHVLNRLATLGARGGLTTPQQQEKLEAVVNRLATADGREAGAFQSALDVLDKLLQQQQRVYEHNLQRVQQASEGHQRLHDARQKVTLTLEDLVGGRRVPRALLTLLDAGWRELLVTNLLRHGEDSAEYSAALDVVTRMRQGIEEPHVIDMKSLLGAIKHGLASQASGQLNREAVVSDLRDMFTALSAGRLDAVPAVDMPEGAVTVSAAPPPAEDSHTLGRWLKRARELEVGDWLEFLGDGDHDTHQARLAWHDEEHTQFVFVNLQGMKVDELDAENLARALRDTRAWRIDSPETPVVDRGLEAMVQKVYGQLSHRATHDELTGLLNRKEFEKRLQRQIENLVDAPAPWILCWLDLDQFKVVNSTCGFEAGNALIIEVARAIAGCIGQEAQVSRLGGDEFAILAPSASDNGKLGPVGHVIEAIDSLRFQWQGRTFPVSASAGVVFLTMAGVEAEEMMKSAETACYAAKEAGRNRVQVFQSDDAQLARRDNIIRWVARLNQAIENDRLQLRCQEIRPIDPQSGLLPHYEILIALEDESGEFIPPSSFMHAAERYNRMHAVDRWVIRNVMQWMHDNPKRMESIGGFSINLSGQSLNDEKLTAYILREVTDSAIAREKVTFEVTETAAIANIADAADFIREMQGIGCKFSLDDFGSGLSSYSYLKNLPVDYVKIDGVFIRDIHKNMSDYMMVRSINEMSHFMGKRTIAEYVENEEILEKLREIGVDFAQGYGIEKPRPLATLLLDPPE